MTLINGPKASNAAGEAGDAAAVDPGEVAKFDRMAEAWWDPKGPMAPLHKMQPVRLDFILDQIKGQFGATVGASRARPLAGLRVLDLGCGAGLLCEPMARLGAEVVGLDASPRAIAAARDHAETMGLAIDYREDDAAALATAVAADDAPAFDVALSFEVIEHAPDPDALIGALAGALSPGGLAIVSTLNRTALSLALGVIAAEYVLGWVPTGTHDWRRFQSPDRLAERLRGAGLTPVARAGFVYEPLADRFRIDRDDLSINYAIAAARPD